MPWHTAPLAQRRISHGIHAGTAAGSEARRQIGSTLHKLRETIRTFEAKEEPQRYKSQITLARRRVEAFTIANELIGRELAGERQEA